MSLPTTSQIDGNGRGCASTVYPGKGTRSNFNSPVMTRVNHNFNDLFYFISCYFYDYFYSFYVTKPYFHYWCGVIFFREWLSRAKNNSFDPYKEFGFGAFCQVLPNL